MSSLDILKFFLAFLFFGYIVYRWVWWHRGRDKTAFDHGRSCAYPVAQTGSQWVPQFDLGVVPGTEIYVPAGDGLYVTKIKDSRADQLRSAMRRWLRERQAIVNMIITVDEPATVARAVHEWQMLKNEYPDRFCLYILHRAKVRGESEKELRDQIAALDTFHPVLLINHKDPSKSAMWIEGYHPVGSKFAYHVEYVAPEQASQDERLEQYTKMFERLLQGPHVEKMVVGGRLKEAA